MTMTRRDLVKTAAAGIAWSAVSRARAQGAGERLRVAIFGLGGMGQGHIDRFIKAGTEVIAVADPDRNRVNESIAKVEKAGGRKPAGFQDFRRALEIKEVDAVVIASCDHWHALLAIHAMLAGKDVYCEKPISHNIVEGRAMVNAAKKLGRVVQVGTQQRSADHFREAIALVRSGVLGRIVETQTWNCEYRPPIGSPVDAPAPDYVDYDLWLGPAPVRPFNPNRFHYNWHWFWDYGGSNLTNWNVHLQDIVHLAMNAWSPRSVAMTGFLAHPGENRDTPDTGTATYEFDTPEGPFWQTYTMRVTNRYAPTGSDGDKHGILFCGRKATLVVDRGGWKLMPEKDSGLEPKEVQGADFIMRHIANFLECVKTRGTPASGIESMHLTTAACHLACISYRVGRRIYWDAQNEKIFRDRELKVVDDEANTLLGRDHRKPWILPQVF